MSHAKAKHLTTYLATASAQAQPQPFDWAGHNCAHFAAGFVALVEGVDALRGQPMPTSLTAARRLVRDQGGLQAWVSRALQRDAIHPHFAEVGDVVLLALSDEDDQAQALALCTGEQAVAISEAGAWVFLPMSQALAAWRLVCRAGVPA